MLEARLHQLDKCYEDVGQNVKILLALAKKDILLEGTQDHDEDVLGLQAVGAEFLTRSSCHDGAKP